MLSGKTGIKHPFAGEKSAGETTPVDVEVTAEGANDPDGKVKNYQFWYYDPLDKEQKLGVVDTQYNQATLTIETAGEADEEHEYVFCVNLTDNEIPFNLRRIIRRKRIAENKS